MALECQGPQMDLVHLSFHVVRDWWPDSRSSDESCAYLSTAGNHPTDASVFDGLGPSTAWYAGGGGFVSGATHQITMLQSARLPART